MKRMAEEYSGQDAKVIWVGFQDRPDKIRGFAEKLGLNRVGFDERNTVARSFGVSYGAGVIFIGPDGMVRSRVAKGFTEAALRKGLEKIISPGQT